MAENNHAIDEDRPDRPLQAGSGSEEGKSSSSIKSEEKKRNPKSEPQLQKAASDKSDKKALAPKKKAGKKSAAKKKSTAKKAADQKQKPDTKEQTPDSTAGKHARRKRTRGKRKQIKPESQELKVKLDPKKVAARAWKIFLNEVSEEGLVLVADKDARELARRSLRVAEIYSQEEAIVRKKEKARKKKEAKKKKSD